MLLRLETPALRCFVAISVPQGETCPVSAMSSTARTLFHAELSANVWPYCIGYKDGTRTMVYIYMYLV